MARLLKAARRLQAIEAAAGWPSMISRGFGPDRTATSIFAMWIGLIGALVSLPALGQGATPGRRSGPPVRTDIFGKNRYFLELMDHGIEIERRVRDGLLEIGKKLGIPPLVTNDSHYTYVHEATAHDALLCIQTGKNLAGLDRFKFDGTGYYLKSTDEMYAIDSSDAWQEGCRNTLLVAEQIDTTGMFEKRDLMPKFDIPEGHTEAS